jgi:hypothetical protein
MYATETRNLFVVKAIRYYKYIAVGFNKFSVPPWQKPRPKAIFKKLASFANTYFLKSLKNNLRN